jgi:hypothetical protein
MLVALIAGMEKPLSSASTTVRAGGLIGMLRASNRQFSV